MALPGFRVARSTSGSAPYVNEYAPASGETFIAGSVVRLIVDNTIKTAADDDAAALGIALEDAQDDSGTLRTGVRVAEFVPDAVFSGDNSGTALSLATHIGDAASLDTVTAPHNVVVGTGGNALFKIVGADATDEDRNAAGNRVLVSVPAASRITPTWTPSMTRC